MATQGLNSQVVTSLKDPPEKLVRSLREGNTQQRGFKQRQEQSWAVRGSAWRATWYLPADVPQDGLSTHQGSSCRSSWGGAGTKEQQQEHPAPRGTQIARFYLPGYCPVLVLLKLKWF